MTNEENILVKHWVLETTLFETNLEKIRKRTTKKPVHDLRVSVKKMRSYLRLRKKITHEPWKKDFIETSELYSSFGEYRDIQISLKLLAQLETKGIIAPLIFKKHIAYQFMQTRLTAKSKSSRYSNSELPKLTDQIKLRVKAYSNKEIADKIISLSSKIKLKIKKLEHHFFRNAHEIRKQLKNHYYWLLLLPKEEANKVMNLKKLDKLLGDLGNWQDHFTLIKRIEDFLTDKNKSVKRLFFRLLQVLKKEKRNLLENAKKHLKMVG